MLEAAVPLAVALTNSGAVKAKVESACNSNANVAHAKDLTQPAQDGSPFIKMDGSTVP
jgi:hypothetical protein